LKEVPETVARSAATYSKALLPWHEHSVGLLDDELLFHSLKRSVA
jgi:chemotaxis-related protein WspD